MKSKSEVNDEDKENNQFQASPCTPEKNDKKVCFL